MGSVCSVVGTGRGRILLSCFTAPIVFAGRIVAVMRRASPAIIIAPGPRWSGLQHRVHRTKNNGGFPKAQNHAYALSPILQSYRWRGGFRFFGASCHLLSTIYASGAAVGELQTRSAAAGFYPDCGFVPARASVLAGPVSTWRFCRPLHGAHGIPSSSSPVRIAHPRRRRAARSVHALMTGCPLHSIERTGHICLVNRQRVFIHSLHAPRTCNRTLPGLPRKAALPGSSTEPKPAMIDGLDGAAGDAHLSARSHQVRPALPGAEDFPKPSATRYGSTARGGPAIGCGSPAVNCLYGGRRDASRAPSFDHLRWKMYAYGFLFRSTITIAFTTDDDRIPPPRAAAPRSLAQINARATCRFRSTCRCCR